MTPPGAALLNGPRDGPFEKIHECADSAGAARRTVPVGRRTDRLGEGFGLSFRSESRARGVSSGAACCALPCRARHRAAWRACLRFRRVLLRVRPLDCQRHSWRNIIGQARPDFAVTRQRQDGFGCRLGASHGPAARPMASLRDGAQSDRAQECAALRLHWPYPPLAVIRTIRLNARRPDGRGAGKVSALGGQMEYRGNVTWVLEGLFC